MSELNLRFPDDDHVVVSFDGEDSGTLDFKAPLTPEDAKDLAWYLETYGANSLGDPDDAEARRIAGRLPELGKALFDAVFRDRAAARLFNAFQDAIEEARLLTLSAESPAILALPWELLHDSAKGGAFVFNESPRISIRRVVAGGRGGRKTFKVQPRERLHLLFIVSRPEGAGFLDPRADPSAVLDALESHAPGRFTSEFLRPPTLDALTRRIDDKTKPAIDILHFDGHGIFDTLGGLPERLTDRAIKLEDLFTGQAMHDKSAPVTTGSPSNTGYLLFESADGQPDLVSSETLGFALHRRNVPLVILSACQSAKQGESGEPMGSVAARLTGAGIPAVVAMTYSVLVATTRKLFGEFYGQLASQSTIGEALDAARLHLLLDPRKYEVQRGPNRQWLKLDDWFVPALYQSGLDVPLLTPTAVPTLKTLPRTNVLPRPESGFFGRKHTLWTIERALADKTRRLTLTGFGGQGKTALAQEAARWLVRTGMFEAAVFVDYARVQAEDALSVAVRQIGSVLDKSLIDASAVTQSLEETPTLVILDNLEAVAAEPLRELLDAAKVWSESGSSRLLLTTRTPDFAHPDYRTEGTMLHRRIVLDGLGTKDTPEDALEWFAELFKLPPAPTANVPDREALITLFDMVRFHPLSIRVLAQQLKTRRPAELGRRLETLLAESKNPASSATEVALPVLVASLKLSLDKLDPAALKVLPRLGVFQGGAFENSLMAVTELGDPFQKHREEVQDILQDLERGDPRKFMRRVAVGLPDDADVPADIVAKVTPDQIRVMTEAVRQELAEIPAIPAMANVWPDLRWRLESAALIEAEAVPGVIPPFLRFHPTLAPMLWQQLGPDERDELAASHRKHYAAIAAYVYVIDEKHTRESREIARRELPNILRAVQSAFEVRDPDTMNFVSQVVSILGIFGLKREIDRLIAQSEALSGEEGSDSWSLYQVNRGDQLLKNGQAAEAIRVFETVLARIDTAPHYLRAAALGGLGRCFARAGQLDLAVDRLQQALAMTAKLDQVDQVKSEDRQRIGSTIPYWIDYVWNRLKSRKHGPSQRVSRTVSPVRHDDLRIDQTRRLTGVLHTELGDALTALGQYPEARKEYEVGLGIAETGEDLPAQKVSMHQLGTLAMHEADLDQAAKRFQAALTLSQKLHDRSGEASARHELGMVFEQRQQWDEAERQFREAAKISGADGFIGGPNGAVSSWHQLASVNAAAGRPGVAEGWYRKAIEAGRSIGDALGLSWTLNNLANLLQTQPGRLTEARQLAQESLALKKDLDPAVSRIWTTYNILGQIADNEAAVTPDARKKTELQAEARTHSRYARGIKMSHTGMRYEMQRHLPLVFATVIATQHPRKQKTLQAALQRYRQPAWNKLKTALQRVVSGERDADRLCADLEIDDAMIIESILFALANPETTAALIPPGFSLD